MQPHASIVRSRLIRGFGMFYDRKVPMTVNIFQRLFAVTSSVSRWMTSFRPFRRVLPLRTEKV